MPRLTNKLTGVTVDVDDELAAQLGSEYQPASKSTTTKKSASSSSSKSDSK